MESSIQNFCQTKQNAWACVKRNVVQSFQIFGRRQVNPCPEIRTSVEIQRGKIRVNPPLQGYSRRGPLIPRMAIRIPYNRGSVCRTVHPVSEIIGVFLYSSSPLPYFPNQLLGINLVGDFAWSPRLNPDLPLIWYSVIQARYLMSSLG